VTPAMEAGICDHVWKLEEIAGLIDWPCYITICNKSIYEFYIDTGKQTAIHLTCVWEESPSVSPTGF